MLERLVVELFDFSSFQISNLINATYETVYMTIISTVFIAIFGFFIGILLFISSRSKHYSGYITYQTTSFVVSVLRSIPFIILIILLLPLSKLITGTILGVNAALPSLIIGLTPFYAKMVETSLNEVDKGILELATSLGANTKSLVFKFLLPESLPSLVSNLTNITISNIGFSAISGVIGAGGLGNLAYLQGFEQNDHVIIYISVIIILLLILIIQLIGNFIVKLLTK